MSQQLTEVPGRPMQTALDALDRRMPQQTSLPAIKPDYKNYQQSKKKNLTNQNNLYSLLFSYSQCVMFHSQEGSDMLLQRHNLQELSPECHEERAELSQVHVHQFCKLIRRLCFQLKIQGKLNILK